MIGGIITLIFGVLSIIMFSQPVITMYGTDSDGALQSYDFDRSLFDFITFEDGQSVYHTTAAVFLILSLVFVGIMLILTLVNLIARASSNKAFIGAKVAGLMFFLCMLVAVIMVGVYCINDMFTLFGGIFGGDSGQQIWQGFADAGMYVTVGWGMLVAFGSSFLCMIFAPRKKK